MAAPLINRVRWRYSSQLPRKCGKAPPQSFSNQRWGFKIADVRFDIRRDVGQDFYRDRNSFDIVISANNLWIALVYDTYEMTHIRWNPI